MKKIIGILLLVFSQYCIAHNSVSQYQRIFLPLYTQGGEFKIAIRTFKMNHVPSFLIVNPQTLATTIEPITPLSRPDFRTFQTLKAEQTKPIKGFKN